MSEIDIVTVGRRLPKLATVIPAEDLFTVSVTWAAGERVGRTDRVSLAPMVRTFRVFRPLRDGTVPFGGVCVTPDGHCLAWSAHPDLEIGAEAVEELAAAACPSKASSQRDRPEHRSAS